MCVMWFINKVYKTTMLARVSAELSICCMILVSAPLNVFSLSCFLSFRFYHFSFCPSPSQNIMPISAAMFRSERMNPVPQCPPRLDVQMLTPVIWSRMPNHFLNPEVGKVNERLGWMLECTEPLTMMALHIPEENRS